MSATTPITILPISARKGDQFTECCEVCEKCLEKGTFIVAIQIRWPNYEANLFLGKKLTCPLCGQPNTVIKIFDDEDETTAEMHILAEDIRNSNGIIRAPIIPDISEKDLRDIFEN